MDRVDEVNEIINQDIPDNEKVKLLNSLLIDLKNEMEAQDQNMHPEIRMKVGEAFKIANQYILDKNSR